MHFYVCNERLRVFMNEVPVRICFIQAGPPTEIKASRTKPCLPLANQKTAALPTVAVRWRARPNSYNHILRQSTCKIIVAWN